MRRKIVIMFCLIWMASAAMAQTSSIHVLTEESKGKVSPFLYGQFIEYMGRCIDGGVYDETSPLSRADGVRADVMEKAKELRPTLLRFPGGTVVKTLHWEDGVGPVEQRRAAKNLVWGGINTFHFGTCEFINYCREIGAEPMLVVNIATGTPDEAAHWVEYCNGTDNTYYANLRRSHGYAEPFNVRYWALGNEEAAPEDAGRHQDPAKYVSDMWHFIKLMKLTDPTIKLIADGERGKPQWNKTVIKGLDGAVDFISFHAYVGTDAYSPYSIFHKIERVEQELGEFRQLMKENSHDRVTNWKKWYRFPPRHEPLKMAIDEWGIWEYQEPPYGTTNTYEWRHALATAFFLNTLIRSADFVGMANWAQMVNILAPIMTNHETSVRQTVFYPLKEYRANTLGELVSVETTSPQVDGSLHALDAVATIDRDKGELSLFVVNLSPRPIKASFSVDGRRGAVVKQTIAITGKSLDAKNHLSSPQKDVVSVKTEYPGKRMNTIGVEAQSILLLRTNL